MKPMTLFGIQVTMLMLALPLAELHNALLGICPTLALVAGAGLAACFGGPALSVGAYVIFSALLEDWS